MSVLTSTPLKAAPLHADALDVTTGASAWVPGAWVPFIAATSGPVQIAGVTLGSPRSYANVDIRLEIGIGTAGAETPIGAVRLWMANSATGGDGVYLVQAPIDCVPAGARVSLRASGSPGSPFTQSFALQYYDALDSDHTLAGPTLTDAPEQAAMVSVTVNTTAWAYSDWFELLAAGFTSVESSLAGIAFRLNPQATDFEVELGAGLVGAELPITTLRGSTIIGNAGFFRGLELPALYPVAAGTRVVARIRKAGTDSDPFTIALRYYGQTALLPLLPTSNPCTITAPRFVAVLDDGATAYIGSPSALRNSATYPGGRVVGYIAARILAIGQIVRQASDWFTGGWSAQQATIRWADTDRARRTVLGVSRPSFIGMQGFLYLVDNLVRLAEGTGWRLLFQGPVQTDAASEHLTNTDTLNDIISTDYSLLRDEKQIPQRTVGVADFPNRPIGTEGFGVPIIPGIVTDEADDNVGAIKLFHVGQITYNSLTKDCWLISGHANGQIRLYQSDGASVIEIPTNDPDAWWPGSDDWTDFVPSNDPWITINGHDYAVAFLDGTRATDAISGDKPLYANVQGMLSVGRTGATVTDAHAIYYLLMTQWIIQSYETGAWAAPPTFEFYPGGSTTLDRVLASSFPQASAVAGTYLPGAFKWGFVLGAGGARIAVRDLIAQMNTNGHVSLATNQYAQLFIKMLDRNRTSFTAGARTITDRVDILSSPAFRIERKPEWHANDMAASYAKNYRDDGTGEWTGFVQHGNAASVVTYQRVITSKREYPLIRDADTASVVLQQQLDFCQDPPSIATWRQSLCGLERDVLDSEVLTHYGGQSSTGANNRAFWIVKETVDPKTCTVTKEAVDVDALLSDADPEAVIEITANSVANPTVVTTAAPHGLETGDTALIGGSNSTPTIDGEQVVTVVTPTTFTVPVNVTVVGSNGSVSPDAGDGGMVDPQLRGYGTDTPGGRGGVIARVTSLADSGPGSLRAVMGAATGPTVFVFETSGTIVLTSDINHYVSFQTLAFQTAPSPGITIRGGGINWYCHDILIQHMRDRPGDGGPVLPQTEDHDAALCYTGATDRIVYDHCTLSWAGGKNANIINLAANGRVTFSHCILSEALYYAINVIVSTGQPSSLNLLLAQKEYGNFAATQPSYISVIGCLLAKSGSRNPEIQGPVRLQFLNNVVYCWGEDAINAYKWALLAYSQDADLPSLKAAIVGNLFIAGPTAAPFAPLVAIGAYGLNADAEMYMSDNAKDETQQAITLFEVGGGGFDPTVASPPVSIAGIPLVSSAAVKAFVLAHAGARPTDRDAVDDQCIDDVNNYTGSMISSQADVGGWPVLAVNTAAYVDPANPNVIADAYGRTTRDLYLYSLKVALQP